MLQVILTVIAIAAFVGFWPFMDFVRVHSMHYRLDDQGLSVDGDLWWRKPIPYWQIESAKVISWWGYLLIDREVSWFKQRNHATRGLTRKFVTVRHRDGRVFILTPDHPDVFVRTLNDRIAGTAPPKIVGLWPGERPRLAGQRGQSEGAPLMQPPNMRLKLSALLLKEALCSIKFGLSAAA